MSNPPTPTFCHIALLPLTFCNSLQIRLGGDILFHHCYFPSTHADSLSKLTEGEKPAFFRFCQQANKELPPCIETLSAPLYMHTHSSLSNIIDKYNIIKQTGSNVKDFCQSDLGMVPKYLLSILTGYFDIRFELFGNGTNNSLLVGATEHRVGTLGDAFDVLARGIQVHCLANPPFECQILLRMAHMLMCRLVKRLETFVILLVPFWAKVLVQKIVPVEMLAFIPKGKFKFSHPHMNFEEGIPVNMCILCIRTQNLQSKGRMYGPRTLGKLKKWVRQMGGYMPRWSDDLYENRAPMAYLGYTRPGKVLLQCNGVWNTHRKAVTKNLNCRVHLNMSAEPRVFQHKTTHHMADTRMGIIPMPPGLLLPHDLNIHIQHTQPRGHNGRVLDPLYTLFVKEGLGMQSPPWHDLSTAAVFGEIQRASEFWRISCESPYTPKFTSTIMSIIGNNTYTPTELKNCLTSQPGWSTLNLGCLMWGGKSDFRENRDTEHTHHWDSINKLELTQKLMSDPAEHMPHQFMRECTPESFLHMPGIYIFVLPERKKVYIGSARSVNRRILSHFSAYKRACVLKRGKGERTAMGCTLYSFLHKSKEGTHLCWPLEIFPSNVTSLFLCRRENWWITNFGDFAMNKQTPLMGRIFYNIQCDTLKTFQDPSFLFSPHTLVLLLNDRDHKVLRATYISLLQREQWIEASTEWILSFLLIVQKQRPHGYRFFYNVQRKTKQRCLKELRYRNIHLPLNISIYSPNTRIPKKYDIASCVSTDIQFTPYIQAYILSCIKFYPPKYTSLRSLHTHTHFDTLEDTECHCSRLPKSWKLLGHTSISILNLHECTNLPSFVREGLSQSSKLRVGRFQTVIKGVGVSDDEKVSERRGIGISSTARTTTDHQNSVL